MSIAHRVLSMLPAVTFWSVLIGLVLGVTSDLRGCLAVGGLSGLLACVLFGALPMAWLAIRKA